jgi:uncharacterized membrane-anchored protein
MRDRFDFEQQLINTWGILDEIKELDKNVLEGKLDGSKMTLDEIANFLAGLESIYSMKFEQLWHDFENVFMDIVRENKILVDEIISLRQQLIAKDE